MRYQGPAYRAIHPMWSYRPTSGEGAAIHGGRFNPEGVPALYLGTSLEVAFLEATQGFAYKFKPLTMCSYDVDCTDLVDLTSDEARQEAGVSLSDMACAWALDLSENRRPSAWTIYDRLHANAAGIRVPSFAVGTSATMSNLVLWDWGEAPPHKVTVFDPDHRLPHDQASWDQ